MNDVESKTWTSFKSVIQNFLGNRNNYANNYGQLFDELTPNYGKLGVNIIVLI